MASTSAPPKKKIRRPASYRPELTAKFPCLVKSFKGPSHIHCTVCFKDFAIDSGANDCQRHVEGPRHIQNARSVASSQPLLSFTKPTNSSLMEAVTKAEVLFTGFLVEHNIPLSASDHASKLFKAMFTSSEHSAAEIIKKYGCARTKTTHIMHEMANDNRRNLLEVLKTSPFSLATDASNDRMEKLYPLVIRSIRDGTVTTDLLSIIEVKGKGTGQNIAKAIIDEFDMKGIPWDNCVSFATDNANVMVGSKNGCYGHLLSKQSELIATGCVCHRLHLAAEWAGKQLPVNVEQFFTDIYYYMEKSAGRVQHFNDLQEACGVRQSALCRHVSTRWLSLRKTADWVLEQWEPLEKFFDHECELDKTEARTINATEQKQERKRKVLDNLKSRTMKLYIKYLAFMLPEFDKANLLMQIEAPMVHVQRKQTIKFIRTLFRMFVKPCAMVGGKAVEDVDYKSPFNSLPKEEIMVGEDVKEYLSKVSTETKTAFYGHVKSFLTTAVTYMLKHGKITESYLHHAEVADIGSRDNAKWSSIACFLDKYPCFMPTGCTKDMLHLEFSSYQCATLPDDLGGTMDQQWMKLAETVKDDVGAKALMYLPTVMLFILAIPHSNASCERVFSIVRKNRTDFRASMSIETLESLLILKQQGIVCHERKPSNSLLKACKEATASALSASKQ